MSQNWNDSISQVKKVGTKSNQFNNKLEYLIRIHLNSKRVYKKYVQKEIIKNNKTNPNLDR